MRSIILVLLCSLTASAQTVTLPTWLIDSMSYEVKRGRQCELVIKSQADELQKQGQELAHVNTALKLSQSESSTLSNLLENSKKGNEILSSQFALDISKEKRKTKRWRKVAVIETVGLVGLLILML